MDKFYITTSIAYTNAAPHIGFALELCQADVIARLARLEGCEVKFSTGTDEHGQKQWETAQKLNIAVQQLADQNSSRFKQLTKELNISNTDFIRTTDKILHWTSAQKIWKTISRRGDIYKKKYQGNYCVGCEKYLTHKEINKGKCLIHQTKPEKQQEENYFFKLSNYATDILAKIESDELTILPVQRKNEIIEFVKSGLEDVSFSRSKGKLPWGIPVPDDDSQIMYVWCDALTNYISVLGFGSENDQFARFWPADIHLIGKDILRFHAVIWPAMLMSAGLPVPDSILVHGFITSAGQKISKSLGNVIDPFELIKTYGADGLRYFLLREIPSGGDGDFTKERFLSRYNGDLANGLGNLVNRVITMIKQNQIIPKTGRPKFYLSIKKSIKEFQLQRGLAEIFGWVGDANRLIDQYKPWERAKSDNPKTKKDLEQFLLELYARIEEIAHNLSVYLPYTSVRIQTQLKTLDPEVLFIKKEIK